jgi:hypothetical protein
VKEEKMHILKICLSILLVMQWGNAVANQEFIDVATGNGSQTAPVIYGDWVAYFDHTDMNSKNFLLKAKNLTTNETLTMATAEKSYPKFYDPLKSPINERFITWIDYRNRFIEVGTDTDVYAFDLVTRKEIRVSIPKGKCLDPFLIGNTVYYSAIFADGAEKSGFYSFDLLSIDKPKLLFEYLAPARPKCYWDEGFIVWFDWASNNNIGAIKLYDIANKTLTDIDTHGYSVRQATIQKGNIFYLYTPVGFTFPGLMKVSIADKSEVVLSEPMQGKSSLTLQYAPSSNYLLVLNVDILLVYNIQTNEFFKPNAKKMALTFGKIVEGDRMVYSTLFAQSNYDVWIHDFKTDTSTPVYTGLGSQIFPVMSGNRVVWWDKSADLGDIRGLILNGGSK